MSVRLYIHFVGKNCQKYVKGYDTVTKITKRDNVETRQCKKWRIGLGDEQNLEDMGKSVIFGRNFRSNK